VLFFSFSFSFSVHVCWVLWILRKIFRGSFLGTANNAGFLNVYLLCHSLSLALTFSLSLSLSVSFFLSSPPSRYLNTGQGYKLPCGLGIGGDRCDDAGRFRLFLPEEDFGACRSRSSCAFVHLREI